MHIGIDARLIYHQPAGISRYTRRIIKAMATLNQTDDFTIFQHRRHAEPLVEQKNFHRATLYSPVHARLEQAMVPLELMRFRLDLLHSPDFIPPLHTRVPTVITVHDLAFLHWPHFLTKASAAYYGQIDRAVHRARHIIVPSESTKKDLIGQLGVPSAKVSVIYEAADARFTPLPIDETRAAVRRKFGLPETYILFVGTIEPRKNISGLLQSFRRLRDRSHDTPVGLAIAGGQGWLFDETLALIEELELQQQVHLLGRVSDDDLHHLYVAARCHVHPAHYEGFGLPPLEAMACGTPTIVSNVSSLPEVVGDAALMVDPQHPEELAVAMQRLLTDDALHAEQREAGLRRARCFSWRIAAHRTLEVYQHVAEVRRSRPASTSSPSSSPSPGQANRP
jgi:glycosyltransferase involved in cell wall biosynthesis